MVIKPGLSDLRHGSRPLKAILAASTGGHLAQLVRFERTWNTSDDSLWITFDTPQSRSLLEGRRVHFVPYVRPRDARGALYVAREAQRLLKNERFDIAVSTGAAIALGVLPIAATKGIASCYLESVSRVNGPSLTGRILSASRLTSLNTQHATWARGRWQAHPSVLSVFSSRDRAGTPADPLRVFVTLGTIKPYRFDALVDGMLATDMVGASTVWQVGDTARTDLPGRSIAEISAEEFRQLATEADVVVTHAGVGTILNLLEWGVHPVVVPRRKARGEHVDDHQEQIANLVGELGVAVVSEAPALRREHLTRAAGLENVARPQHASSATGERGN